MSRPETPSCACSTAATSPAATTPATCTCWRSSVCPCWSGCAPPAHTRPADPSCTSTSTTKVGRPPHWPSRSATTATPTTASNGGLLGREVDGGRVAGEGGGDEVLELGWWGRVRPGLPVALQQCGRGQPTADAA